MAGLLIGLLSACAPPGGSTGSAQPTPSAEVPRTTLTITISDGSTAAAKNWTLSCTPVGGTHPKAETACAFVTKNPHTLLDPVPAGQACTQIFGGPQVATVKGTWRGTPVNARLSRTNGCEIARWDRVKALIGDGGN